MNKKRLWFILILFFLSTSAFCEWEKHDKVLLGTYLLGETIDVLQTSEAFKQDEFREMNPLIKNDTDLLISAFLTTSIIIWASNHFEEHRTEILAGCNVVKWGFVVTNHSIGVRINF